MGNGQTDQFRTDNMVLATLLRMEGFEPELECQYTSRGGKQAVWVFGDSASIQGIVDDFDSDEALVEPRAFAILWAEVRKEMFEFLDPSRVSRDG